MLGTFANPSGSNGIEPIPAQLRSKAAAKETNLTRKKQDQILHNLLERDWPELPYAMMRLTAARRPWDANRVYWRDRTVQLGDIDLDLAKTSEEGAAPTYTAVYANDELRREFTLHPSLEDEQLRWSAPGIAEVQLTTDQLAEKLLSKLVTFYASGLTSGLLPPATSSASPDPAS